MKFYFLGIAMIMLLPCTANAQEINIGIKGGLNLYNIAGSDLFKSKAGINFGLLGHIHLNEQFALQPEIFYSGQGAKFGNTDYKLKSDYINVPVLLQYMFDNGFRLQAGPQVGFLVNAKSRIDNVKTDVKNDFKNIDLGLSLGVSYIHPATGFGVDARYNHGLTNINAFGPSELKNRGFQLGLFYLFRHKS